LLHGFHFFSFVMYHGFESSYGCYKIFHCLFYFCRPMILPTAVFNLIIQFNRSINAIPLPIRVCHDLLGTTDGICNDGLIYCTLI
jgi:hypothetical protein